MIPGHESKTKLSSRALHRLGVACGLAAGAWLGAAEAPTKLVTAGYSPFLISLGMVAGVFVARWTVPMALKGTSYILLDLREKVHLIIWAILAGMLWAVANTLTVFAFWAGPGQLWPEHVCWPTPLRKRQRARREGLLHWVSSRRWELDSCGGRCTSRTAKPTSAA